MSVLKKGTGTTAADAAESRREEKVDSRTHNADSLLRSTLYFQSQQSGASPLFRHATTAGAIHRGAGPRSHRRGDGDRSGRLDRCSPLVRDLSSRTNRDT